MLEKDFKDIVLNLKSEIKTSQTKTMIEINKNLILHYLILIVIY